MSLTTRAHIFQFLVLPAMFWIWLVSWPVDLYASIIAVDGKDVRSGRFDPPDHDDVKPA